jgi:prepilin-type N-terminal cleavage/methylation domain-containing protein
VIAALRQRPRDDDGMTMVELIITSAVLVVLLGMVLLSMNLIESLDANVTAQYQEFDQVVPSLAPLRTLVASEVEPAMPASGVPTPAFQSIGNFSATWTTNVGTNYDNVVGASNCPSLCTAGPAQVVAEELDGNGNPVVSTSAGPNTTCSSKSPCSFQVRLYLPMMSATSPGTSTCPVPINGTPNGTCQYSSSYKLISNIQDVVNNPASVDGSGNPLHPIFTYTVADATTANPLLLTAAMINNPSGVISGSQPLNTCTGTTGLLCPLDDIQSVTIHLRVQRPATNSSGVVDNTIVEYRQPLSAISGCYSYQYSNQCDPYEG